MIWPFEPFFSNLINRLRPLNFMIVKIHSSAISFHRTTVGFLFLTRKVGFLFLFYWKETRQMECCSHWINSKALKPIQNAQSIATVTVSYALSRVPASARERNVRAYEIWMPQSVMWFCKYWWFRWFCSHTFFKMRENNGNTFFLNIIYSQWLWVESVLAGIWKYAHELFIMLCWCFWLHAQCTLRWLPNG